MNKKVSILTVLFDTHPNELRSISMIKDLALEDNIFSHNPWDCVWLDLYNRIEKMLDKRLLRIRRIAHIFTLAKTVRFNFYNSRQIAYQEVEALHIYLRF